MVKTVVAILNRNNDKQLEQCLDSLLQQSVGETVTVVVDGGSTDNSLRILEKYSKNDSRILFFVQISRGTGRARNELIEYVEKHFPEAEKIVWGDSENLYDPNYLSNLLSVDADVVGGVSIIDSDSPLSQSLWWYYNGFNGRTVAGNNEAVELALYRKYCYPAVTRTEDFFLHKQLRRDRVKIEKVDNAICFVRTVKSFSEFVNWEKSRAKGLCEGVRLTKSTSSLFATYLLVVLTILSYFALLPIFAVFNPLLLIPHASILVAISLYLWIKGRSYVKKLRMKTFLYFIPVFFADPLIVLFTLLRQRSS